MDSAAARSEERAWEHSGRLVANACIKHAGAIIDHMSTANVVRECGYLAACSTLWGTRNRASDLYALRRVVVHCDDDLDAFGLKDREQELPAGFGVGRIDRGAAVDFFG